jgi:hypothetical protein
LSEDQLGRKTALGRREILCGGHDAAPFNPSPSKRIGQGITVPTSVDDDAIVSTQTQVTGEGRNTASGTIEL